MTHAFEPIGIADTNFLISREIEQCPRTMMIRELFQNAIEAALHAPEGDRRIEFQELPVDLENHAGVKKLAIMNTGPGMTPSELLEMTNLSSSIGKKKGLDGNFGIGAKVASLPSNNIGLLYHTCRDGVVSEVRIGKQGNSYGRFKMQDANGNLCTVMDLTACTEASMLAFDWTRVILLGNREEQDTVRDPYDGDPKVDGASWIYNTLLHRYFRIPGGIAVKFRDGTYNQPLTEQQKENLGRNRRSEPTFVPYIDRRFHVDKIRYEAVTHEQTGIVVHFTYDPPYDKEPSKNVSSIMSAGSHNTMAAVVYRNEMYDVLTKANWTGNAARMGITFGARHLSVHIELPDDYAVRPESYRRDLNYTSGERNRVSTIDFSDLVRACLPAWVAEIVEASRPVNLTNRGQIQDNLKALMDRLSAGGAPSQFGFAKRSKHRVMNGGDMQLVAEKTDGEGGESTGASEAGVPPAVAVVPNGYSLTRVGGRAARLYPAMDKAPRLHELRTKEDIEENGLTDRAGKYIPETGDLFVNLRYGAFDQMRSLLMAGYSHISDPTINDMIEEYTTHTIMSQVGRHAVYALAKRKSKQWTDDAVSRALSPESISIAADDFEDSLEPIRRRLSTKFRTSTRAEAE